MQACRWTLLFDIGVYVSRVDPALENSFHHQVTSGEVSRRAEGEGCAWTASARADLSVNNTLVRTRIINGDSRLSPPIYYRRALMSRPQHLILFRRGRDEGKGRDWGKLRHTTPASPDRQGLPNPIQHNTLRRPTGKPFVAIFCQSVVSIP